MLRNSDSHNEKYGWNSIPNSIPKNTLGGSRFNLEINGIFRCLDISFVSLPLNDVTRTSSWLSKSPLFATIDENGDEPRPHLQWWMHFWAEMPTAKSTRGMATTAPDEEPNRRESLFRLSLFRMYTDILKSAGRTASMWWRHSCSLSRQILGWNEDPRSLHL